MEKLVTVKGKIEKILASKAFFPFLILIGILLIGVGSASAYYYNDSYDTVCIIEEIEELDLENGKYLVIIQTSENSYFSFETDSAFHVGEEYIATFKANHTKDATDDIILCLERQILISSN